MAAVYQRILLAVDLAPDSHLIGQRARAIADVLGAELYIVHVIEPLAPPPPIPPQSVAPTVVTLQAELVQTAQEHIGALADELAVAPGDWSIVDGDIKTEIVRTAMERNVDLLVIGTRGRHALAFLIKPTEDVVVHRAPCDVLAVRLPD
jgi:universal stress protein A